METLNQTEPHYIRCVKPNMVNKPGRFENVNVLQQLRCGVSALFVSLTLQVIYQMNINEGLALQWFASLTTRKSFWRLSLVF